MPAFRTPHSALRLGVACSAGADSTLALLLAAETHPAHLLVALHFNHATRGAESDADELAARELAARLAIPFVSARRAPSDDGSENALRRDRLAFFKTACAEHTLDAIVTGHHADDVAETMLLRLARGAATAGLSAPRPDSTGPDGLRFLRPLLATRKADILAALRARGVPWREDASNADPAAARRNALRNAVMPLWIQYAGPDPVAGALRSRALLQEDADALDDATAHAQATLCPGTPEEDWAAVRSQPRAILRRLLHRALIRLGRHDALTAAAFDTLLAALAAGTPTRTSVATGHLVFDAHRLLFLPSATFSICTLQSAILPVPGALFYPTGATLSATCTPDTACNVECSVLSAAPRVAGARYTPHGAPGSSKISDMMINRKIPAALRDTLPVVSDPTGPLWSPGLTPAARLFNPVTGTPALRLTWTPPPAPCPAP